MTVPADRIAKIALDRVKSARTTADGVSAYSGSERELAQIKLDLNIAAELLALIAAPSSDDAA